MTRDPTPQELASLAAARAGEPEPKARAPLPVKPERRPPLTAVAPPSDPAASFARMTTAPNLGVEIGGNGARRSNARGKSRFVDVPEQRRR